jgi:phosphoribosylglycinamide formyltransferase-1
MKTKKNIAIFASGSGTNAEQLILKSQANDLNFSVKLIITNNENAGVLKIAHKYVVPCFYWTNKSISNHESLIRFLLDNKIDLIVLAGYLKKIAPELVEAFPNKIVNLHPALLPKFGGKGMYGHHVHEAVLKANEKQSGITIHYVDEQYDEGNIIAQFIFDIDEKESLDSLQKKIQTTEHSNFYKVIDDICSTLNNK